MILDVKQRGPGSHCTHWLPMLSITCVFLFVSLLSNTTWSQTFKFVSIPDFHNYDIATITHLPTYDGGADSSTASYESTLDYILDSIAAEQPDFVLVAGDLVMGHWDRDVDNRQIFGPVNSLANKTTTVSAAADHYYDAWLNRFSSRGLTLYPAVGDHELGDNNWGANTDKAHLVPTYKSAFAKHFTQDNGGNSLFTQNIGTAPPRPLGSLYGDSRYEDTAYAFQHNNTLFVTVDVFRQDSASVSLDNTTGSVLATVDGAQLQWLGDVLTQAHSDPSIDHIIVQGHTPVLEPVRARNSSRLLLRDYDGTLNRANADTSFDTDFWQLLEQHNVDFYFAGEVHDITASQHGGVQQIAHGALIGAHSPINYLVGTVSTDAIDLQVKEIAVELGAGSMWQTGSNRPRSELIITQANRNAGYQTVGTLTLDKSTSEDVVTRTGKLQCFGECDLGVLPLGLQVHLSLDELNGSSASNSGLSGALNDGILQGDATFTSGMLGNAIQLDGNGDRVLAGVTPFSGNAQRTVSLWVNTTTTGEVDTALTFGVNSSGSKWDTDVDGTTGGVIELGVGNGRTVGSGAVLNDGQWHLMTVVLQDGDTNLSQVLFFVDGVFQYTNSVSNERAINTQIGGNLILGHAANSDFFQAFSGMIDDVALWSTELSADQVKSLYDVANGVGLNYDAGKFELLRQVFVGDLPAVKIGNLLWRKNVNLSGSAGLSGAGNSFSLVMDAVAGSGVFSVEALPGDFNLDGNVDHLDLMVWRSAYGASDLGDSDGDGDTDGADFLQWQRHFGLSANPSASLAKVPEPNSVLLALVLSSTMMLVRRA
ncbi:MAG: LamG domain-containing protein [Pirellulales bacterium]|nr:LamG domain-containing protein [Pirellulales bacterium]